MYNNVTMMSLIIPWNGRNYESSHLEKTKAGGLRIALS